MSGSLDLQSSTIQRIRSSWLFIPTAYLDIPRELSDISRRSFAVASNSATENRRGSLTGMPDKNKLGLFEAHRSRRRGDQFYDTCIIVAHIKWEFHSFHFCYVACCWKSAVSLNCLGLVREHQPSHGKRQSVDPWSGNFRERSGKIALQFEKRS